MPLLLGLLLAVADDLKDLRARAEKGDAEAQYQLGLRYHKGNGVEKDDKAALEWYLKAAAKDHTQAEVQLGYLHAHGFGTKQDFAGAAKWYRKAALKGDPTAQHNLGLQALHGQGMKKDEQLAAQWLILAATQGHARSQFDLGRLQEEGQGTEKSPTNALIMYTLAAAHPEQDRVFGKEKAAELVQKRDKLREALSPEERAFCDKAAVVMKAMIAVHPRRFGMPGGVGQVRGWYIWEKWDPRKRIAEVRHETRGDVYKMYVAPWGTTYRRLVYGAGPDDLLPGERVNLFFAPDGFRDRGFLVHFQDEIGQMKGHGHFWQVLSVQEKEDRFTAQVMAGDKPLDSREYFFQIHPECQRWRDGKLVKGLKPAKGDRLFLTWTQQGGKNVVHLLSDDASLKAIQTEEQARVEKRYREEGFSASLQMIEDGTAHVMLFATSWQQAAKLREGQDVRLYGSGKDDRRTGEAVPGRITFRKNRGTYGSGVTDMLVELKEPADAKRVRGWLFKEHVRLFAD
jgi:hypothetical protein